MALVNSVLLPQDINVGQTR
uniref:Uncharacterized protein n=1 Tax=Arundo donax TaxID=35708 RepID=A0A0A9FNG4_ARUDO